MNKVYAESITTPAIPFYDYLIKKKRVDHSIGNPDKGLLSTEEGLRAYLFG
ncbi:hypothetical protein U6A24_03055 [Aquimarina gracilis]|uniref:Uncharacterized protein n=1 Tax=Aquimarina gracilis TaxID=874422 RepID=A0ABU5ZQR7_9FLAO|nr:hypothetical protein [Aquimarina gracilis]MEB3344420.1 hypothetical protein [Aquimarina gracilis]